VQPAGDVVERGSGEELDRADPPFREVDRAAPLVPHPHAVGEVVGVEAVEVDHGPALEHHPQDAIRLRLDPREVAEARQERPAEVDRALPLRDLDPEDLERGALGDLLGGTWAAQGFSFLEPLK
jgi:hypothetical protein